MSQPPISGASLGLERTNPDAPANPDAPESDELLALELDQADRYREGGLIGRGGMGEIRSVQDARLGRTVAIKTPVARDAETTRQFVAEATLTARLAHPGIVAVHDAGRTREGRPYYTMPIVHGRSLAEAIADTNPSERLRLVRHFLDACEAIAYAHSQGVLHRDLKPSNILVGRFGETIVVDWGLAGPVGASASAGTPDYMPPEQICREALQPSADVYALGITLHTILTGSSVGRPPPGTPPELLAIVERATRDDPEERYPDGRALAEDVAAWFEGRRVAAHRYSLAELLARVWAAHRAALSIALLAVVGIAIAIFVGVRRTAAEHVRAQESEQQALAAQARAEANLAQAEVAQALVAMAQDAWPQAELFAAGALVHGPSPAARGVLARFDGSARPQLIERSRMPRCARRTLSARGDRIACSTGDAIAITRVDAIADTTTIALHGDPVALFDNGLIFDTPSSGMSFVDIDQPERSVALQTVGSRPHSRFVGEHGRFAWISGGLEFWTDVDTGIELRVDATMWCRDFGHAMPGVVGVRSNGSRVAFCQDGGVLVTDPSGAAARELLRLDPSLGAPLVLGLSAGSRYAALNLAGGSVVVLDLDEGRVIRTISGIVGSPSALALTESRLALSDGRESVYVWEIESGALLVRLKTAADRLHWLDDGMRLRLIGDSREDWLLPAPPTRPHVRSAGSGIAALSISPSGRDLLTAHGDGRVRLIRLDGSRESIEIPLHRSVVKDIEFSPDGTHALAVCAQDRNLYVIDLANPTSPRTIPAPTAMRVAWLVDDRLILAPYEGGLAAWRADASEPTTILPSGTSPKPRVADMASDADRRGLTFLEAGWVHRMNAEGEVVRVAERAKALAIAGSEDFVVLASVDTLEILSTRSGGSRVAALAGPLVNELALSGDGRYIALGHIDGSVTVWSSQTLERLAVLHGHVGRVAALAFDARGEWLISGSWDGDVRQWSMRALERSPSSMLAEAEAAWGLTLAELLASN